MTTICNDSDLRALTADELDAVSGGKLIELGGGVQVRVGTDGVGVNIRGIGQFFVGSDCVQMGLSGLGVTGTC